MIILLSSTISLILLFWFKTEVILEYASIFKLQKLFKIKEFRIEKIKIAPERLPYHTFLLLKYNNFFTRLLSCYICFSFWCSLLICICAKILMFTPIVCVLSLILYSLILKYDNK